MEFRVLGPLEVVGDGAVAIGSAQQRRVLAALLAAEGAVVSADVLVDALWGDKPPATARKTLQSHVSRLRSLLGAAERDVLLTRPPGYVLHVHPDAVDARRFERLVSEARAVRRDRPRAALDLLDQALALWRGPVLAEFADAEWARAPAVRLEELRLVAVEERFQAKLALGAHAEVIGELEALIDAAPLRERPRALLMLALYRCGRHAEALAAYQSFRDLLDDELGLDPSDDLQALQRDILQRRPALAWQQASDLAGLPAEASSFVGRAAEIAAVSTVLGEARIVTLTGVGGVGKTRLALRTAAAVAAHYADGACWCELAPVTDPDAVAHAIATAVGAHAREGRTVEEAVVDVLRSKRLLLVVDNCEHLLDAASQLVDAVARGCPQVTVLTTSRTRLGIAGEHVWHVPPLPVDDGENTAATELFRDRARAVRPQVDLHDATAIGEVCRQLEGLPLAIELAAARLRALSLDELSERLADRFRLLTSTPARGRHGALRTVVDWSYGLLSDVEQRLFDRLSLFAGGFSLTAAERVCSGGALAEDEVLDLLTRLVDSSMVVAGASQGESRYTLLEMLRQYGDERLEQRGERQAARAAHARHFLEVAEDTAQRMRGPDEAAAAAVVERDLANLRAAYRYAVETGDADCALRLVVALHWDATWRMRDEVFGWAEDALALPRAGGHPLFPTACGAAAWGAGLRGQRDAAQQFAERGAGAVAAIDASRLWPVCVLAHLALWSGRLDECVRYGQEAAELSDEPYEVALPLEVQALALTYAGRSDEALAVLDRLQPLVDALGNPSAMALARYGRGEALLETDPERAAELFEEVAALCAAVSNRIIAGVAGVSLASLRARHGTPQQALRSFRDVIEVLQRAGDWTHLWVGLRSLVELFTRIRLDEAAAVLHGAVLGAATAPPVYGADAERLAAVHATLEERLGAEAIATARAQGRAMTDQQVMAFVRREIEGALSTRPG